jgi:hypothetical protein
MKRVLWIALAAGLLSVTALVLDERNTSLETETSRPKESRVFNFAKGWPSASESKDGVPSIHFPMCDGSRTYYREATNGIAESVVDDTINGLLAEVPNKGPTGFVGDVQLLELQDADQLENVVIAHVEADLYDKHWLLVAAPPGIERIFVTENGKYALTIQNSVSSGSKKMNSMVLGFYKLGGGKEEMKGLVMDPFWTTYNPAFTPAAAPSP